MKRREALTALDVLAVTREMNARLKGAFLDKVYQLAPDDVLLRVNARSGEGKATVMLLGGRRAQITDLEVTSPKSPTPFAASMRKRVSNAVIESVEQVGFDRLMKIRLAKGGPPFDLIVELLPDGAIALVLEGKIEIVAKPKVFKSRKVTPKADYVPPTASPDPRGLGPQGLVQRAGASSDPLAKALAREAGLGPGLAEEVVLRARLDGQRAAKSLALADWRALDDALKAVVDAVENSPAPSALLSGDTMVEFSPIPLKRWGSEPHRTFDSMSALFDAYFGPYHGAAVDDGAAAPRPEEAAELDRLKRILAQQDEVVAAAKGQVAAAQGTAEALFANYPKVEVLLNEAPRGTTGAALTAAIKKAGLQHSAPEPVGRGVAVLLDLPGPDGIMRRPQVTLGDTVNEIAQRYYKDANREKDRLKGALEARKETEAAIALAQKKMDKVIGARRRASDLKQEAKDAGVPPPPKKREWFERFRWMRTSDGHLVVAGRDAATNDLVVKKYLKPGDRYAHADVHGAPSVVIKRAEGEAEIPAEPIEEACVFAALHSRIWSSGAGEGSSYWVTPDQVSKTPESGEHLGRGAFVIRGKRHTVRHVKMQAAIGGMTVKEERKAMCGPKAAVAVHCDIAFMVGPGKRKPTDVAKELAPLLRVHPDEIARALPPGGCEVVGPLSVDGAGATREEE